MTRDMTKPSCWRAAGAVLGLGALLLAAPAARAGMDLSRLDPEDRAVLNDILVGVLSDMPEILTDPRIAGAAPPPLPADPYAEAVASDLARIGAHGEELFAPSLPGFGAPAASRVIALFTRADCGDCTRAEADLRLLAQAHDLRVTLIDMDRNAALAEALELETAPAYVFPDMMLQGHIPPIVLERYLSE